MKTYMHVITKDQDYAVASKTLEGEYTSFGIEAIAYEFLNTTCIDKSIDTNIATVLHCKRNGVVINRYTLED